MCAAIAASNANALAYPSAAGSNGGLQVAAAWRWAARRTSYRAPYFAGVKSP